MSELAEALKNQNLVLRKIDSSEMAISYQRKKADQVDSLLDDGFYVTECDFDFTSEDGDPSPYWDKPLPFDPEVLLSTCGDSGYGYYIDDPAEDPDWI